MVTLPINKKTYFFFLILFWGSRYKYLNKINKVVGTAMEEIIFFIVTSLVNNIGSINLCVDRENLFLVSVYMIYR